MDGREVDPVIEVFLSLGHRQGGDVLQRLLGQALVLFQPLVWFGRLKVGLFFARVHQLHHSVDQFVVDLDGQLLNQGVDQLELTELGTGAVFRCDRKLCVQIDQQSRCNCPKRS